MPNPSLLFSRVQIEFSPMEANEISEFSKQMKEAGESSLTGIALAISILAVLVAMVTVLSHRSHTEAVLMQARAGDQWNQYQAKRIRQESLLVTIDMLGLQPVQNAAATEAKLAEYKAHIAKWDKELPEEQDKARELEAEVALAERHAGRFDLGEALLQIAVVLSSVTLLTRQRMYFYFGLTLGLVGLFIAASSLLLH